MTKNVKKKSNLKVKKNTASRCKIYNGLNSIVRKFCVDQAGAKSQVIINNSLNRLKMTNKMEGLEHVRSCQYS